MASENSFDIVSKVDLQEVSNAIQIALKEVHTRFDLKDSKSDIQLEKDAIILTSADEYKLKAVTDILQSKLVKRGVPIKALTYGVVEAAAGRGAAGDDEDAGAAADAQPAAPVARAAAATASAVTRERDESLMPLRRRYPRPGSV